MGAASAEDVASAVCREVALQLLGMRLVPRACAKDDAALADAAVVFRGALFGDAGADQYSDERTRSAAGARRFLQVWRERSAWLAMLRRRQRVVLG